MRKHLRPTIVSLRLMMALMSMMLVGCLAETVSSPARNGGARAPLDGDRYTTERPHRGSTRTATAKRLLPTTASKLIADDCSDTPDPSQCTPSGGGGGGGGGGDGDGVVEYGICSVGSWACGYTDAYINDLWAKTPNRAAVESETYTTDGSERLLTAIGGGILKRGANLSFPTGIAILCVQVSNSCYDRWEGPNTCYLGEWNWMAVGVSHTAVFPSAKFTGKTSDTESCNGAIEFTLGGGTGGGGSGTSGTGDDDGYDTGDDGGAEPSVAVYETGSSCDIYNVVEIYEYADGSWTRLEYDLEVCDA
jgi:hypothetical protein